MVPEQGGDMEPAWFLVTLVLVALCIYGYAWLIAHIIKGIWF